MIPSSILLDDRALAQHLLDREELSPADGVAALRLLLKMKYFPVAVKFFYDPAEKDFFQQNTRYRTARHPFTFCHFVAASRQRGDILLGTPETIGCSEAKYVLGWKEKDEGLIQNLRKYTKNRDQAERFLADKKRLPPGLLAFATAPLHLAPFTPDVIHGIGDVLQVYHLGVDWCAAFDTHPFSMTMTVNSSVCHGIVVGHLTGKPNITPMCSGSYTAGKTEQGEINWIWPGGDFGPTVRRLLERTVQAGGASLPRPGEPYPGFQVCKLCPYLVFREPVTKRAGD